MMNLRTAWALSEKDLFNELEANPKRGLSSQEAKQRLRSHGANRLFTERRQSSSQRALSQFKSSIVLTLLVAAAFSAFLGEWIDALAIVLIVLLNAVIGFFQESKAESAVEALRQLAVPRCRVMRDQRVIEISSIEVVPGDILVLEAGDFVAADARILDSNQFSVDEAVLTGESLPIAKQSGVTADSAPIGDRNNAIFAGTAVASGSAHAMVFATAMNTELGKIAKLLKSAGSTETPLQRRLKQVSSKLLIFSGFVVGLVAVLGFVRRNPALEILMGSISLAVAAVPEGLPAVVTISLALAVQRMTRRNAIVRHLPAVETLGSTTVICTDKTGTLTTGKMRVREVFVPQLGILPLERIQRLNDPGLSKLIVTGVVCSNASLVQDEEGTGDPTEIALLLLAKVVGQDVDLIHSSRPRLKEWSFDSNRKRMSVAVSGRDEVLVVVKGAPESVFPLCIQEPELLKEAQGALQLLSSQGRRVLAVAERRLRSQTDIPDSAAEAESNLKLLGLVSIADPPRSESLRAIRRCQEAGVKVVMITGDHPVTARAIAQELGILGNSGLKGVLSGEELARMSFDDLKRIVQQTSVYARVSPEDKLQIVRAWKSLGAVVAMTGDGVNDAPALKEASIGVAMGKGGTEVARQASSLVLADDRFETIVTAIEEGRAIHGNIRRAIQYLLSGNLAEILIMLGAVAAGWPVPLAPIHLLWINLVTDGLPSLALAAEPVPSDVLKTTSRPSPQTFLDRAFYFEVALVGVVTTVLALAIYGYSLGGGDEIRARTHLFSFLVFAELFRSFACRSETKTYLELGPRSNLYHLAAVAVPIGFQLLLHHTTVFQDVFKVHPISWSECLLFIGVTLIPVTLIELRKLAMHRYKMRVEA